ncbi:MULTISPECIES: hypothetical protein [Clostridium]|nr:MULTISPECIES: hypothetical protein [Clostridium]MDB1931803.1 hypothetical protein [Clostridium tertium]MDB1935427.1 hypothetical protein [Clostridium tertium]MDB1968823.1 hypothetical protein [Clostridium tertium]MDU1277621.1 hypothetical protein [Clostridium sp.]MDU1568499.1 hypothetical protein [Clostridium sp.]
MNYLENEKERIKYYYQKLLIGVLLFFYFVVIQSDVSSHKVIWGKGLDPKPISFINPILVFGVIILTLYLNNHLFWIKEQGKRVFILRKYDTIPLSKKEMYSSKFKIIINNLLTFLLGDIIIYIGTMMFNSYLEIDILMNIVEILKVILVSVILIGFLLIINLIQDNKTKREV